MVLDAGTLGAKYMMLALMAQPDVEGQDRGQFQDALVRNIRPIASYGKEQGITVSVEDTLEFYQNLKERVVYVHLKDMEYTDQPEGTDPTSDGCYIRTAIHGKGVIDFQSVLNALYKDGYDGWLMIEYAGNENHRENIRAAQRFLDFRYSAGVC